MKSLQIVLFLLAGFSISFIGDGRLTSVDEEKYAQQLFEVEESEYSSLSDREPAQTQTPVGSPNDVGAPIIAPAGADKVNVGVLSMDTSDTQSADQIDEIRREFVQAEKKKNVLINTTKRFPVETMTFFVAAGAVTFTTMWNKSHGNPLEMERHIMSLKDPISHISFYSFMLSQGYYMDFFEKKGAAKVLNQAGYVRMMTRLSYQGMALGSITSSIVASLGQSIQMCANKWIDGKKDEASLASCKEAWKQWTVRKKSTEMFPMVVNMMASQAVSDFIHTSARSAFEKIETKALQKIAANPKLAIRLMGADMALAFVPGVGWVGKGMKFLGKVTHFAGFLAIDKILSTYTNRPLNNVILPFMSYYDFKKMNKLWLEADQANWDPAVVKKVNSNSAEEFSEEIENYGENMRAWRSHLGQDFEMDMQGWLEMTKKLLDQEAYSFKFYKEFTDNLYETLNNKYQVDSGYADKSTTDQIQRYPIRTLPFYGIKPGAYKDVSGNSIYDLYLTNLNELEQKQKGHILKVAEKFKNKKISNKDEKTKFDEMIAFLQSADNKKMAQGLLKLNHYIAPSELALKEMSFATLSRVQGNPVGGWLVEKKAKYDYKTYSQEFTNVLWEIKTQLGKPQPVIYPLAGYAQAVAANSGYKKIDQQADYSKWSVTKRYNFNKTADLMIYNILCGGSQAKIRKFKAAGVSWLSPEFVGPSLLNVSQIGSYCNSISTSTNMYNSTIGEKSVINHFIENLDHSALADIKSIEYKPSPFPAWWKAKTEGTLQLAFGEYDKEYIKVTGKAYDAFYGRNDFYKRFADFYSNYQKPYYPMGIEKSLRAESSVYIQLINRALLHKVSDETIKNSEKNKNEKTSMIKAFYNKAKSLVSASVDTTAHILNFRRTGTDKDQDYILKSIELSKKPEAFYSLYSNQHKGSVRKLNQLLNDYFKFVGSGENRYDEFLEHSRKFDTAVNEVLVAAGIMIKIEKSQQNDDAADIMSLISAQTGIEISPYAYVPKQQHQLKDLKEKVQYFSQKIVGLVRDGKTSNEDLKVQGQKYDKAISNLDFAFNKNVYSQNLKNIRNWYVKSINDLKTVKANEAFIAKRKEQINLHHEKMLNELFKEIDKDPVDMGYRQKVIVAAVDQLRQVEAEIKRFVRMGTLLSNSLKLDNKEMLSDFSR